MDLPQRARWVVTTALLIGVPAGFVAGAWTANAQQYWQLGLTALARDTTVSPVWPAVLIAGLACVATLAAGHYVRHKSWPAYGLAIAAALWPLIQLSAYLQRLLDSQIVQENVAFAIVLAQLATANRAVAPVVFASVLLVVGVLFGGRPVPTPRRWPVFVEGLAAVFSVVALGGTLGKLTSTPTGPTVVVIAIDTLRADHLGLYGHTANTDPALAALAADAVVFDNAVAPAPWTSPSMAAAATGQYPRRFGFTTAPVRVPDSTVLLAEVFRNAGYRTVADVANLYAGSAINLDQGYQIFDETEAQGHEHISSKALTDHAIARIQPDSTLMYVHYFDPHFGYADHPAYGLTPSYDGPIKPLAPIEELREAAPTYTQSDKAYLTGLYDSEIRYTDEHIGRLLAALKSAGLYDDAIIVVFGDHGETFAERDHWIGHTRIVWEELLHVPFLIKLPQAARAGTRIQTPVSLVDVPPTVAHLAGLNWPAPTDGIVLDPAGPAARPVFAETHRQARLRSVRDGSSKLIVDLDTAGAVLFDLAADPGETTDLAESRPADVARLTALLTRWSEGVVAGPSEAATFTADQDAMLEALGYIED